MLSMNDLEIWNRVLDEQTEGVHRYGNNITLEALKGMRLLLERCVNSRPSSCSRERCSRTWS